MMTHILADVTSVSVTDICSSFQILKIWGNNQDFSVVLLFNLSESTLVYIIFKHASPTLQMNQGWWPDNNALDP
jgi:hypothetical protein